MKSWEETMMTYISSTIRRARLRLVVAALMSLLLVGGALAQSDPSGTLKVGMESPSKLDPAYASSDAEIAVLNAVYDYLVDVDADNNIQPRLATSWHVSQDGLTYTFELAKNATWHDGSPVTAQDVVYTFDRLRNPDLKLPTSDLYADIDTIKATGTHEVTFTLKHTNPFFLYDLSDNHAVIVKNGTTDFGKTFDGSGPFVVQSYHPDDRMVLTANPHYFMAGKPGVAKLELIFFSDQAAEVSALRGGQIDVAMRLPSSLYESLKNVKGITRLDVPTNGFNVVRLRSDRKPGSDPRVVEALKLAVDRQAVTQAVTQGLGVVGNDTPIGPLYKKYYDASATPPKADPAKAKQLLKEAGYPNGLKLDLYTPNTGDRPDLAVVLKQQLAKAGFDVHVVVEPESVYYGDNKWLQVDFGITGWGSRPYPQFYLNVMLECGAKWNESHYCNPAFDKLAKEAGNTLDAQTRIEDYHKIQQMLASSGPIVIPYFFPQLGAIRDGFTGFQLKAFAGRTDLAAVHAK
ncbi:MAG: ABC transporter substrate-binding protein [Deinococcales bacterium]